MTASTSLRVSPPSPAHAAPITPRAFNCRCGRPVFFGNSECLACRTPLGYEPTLQQLLPLVSLASPEPVGSFTPPAMAATPDLASPVEAPAAVDYAGATPMPVMSSASGLYALADANGESARYRRCFNLDTAAACNWLVDEAEVQDGSAALCRCCRLTRTLPDLAVTEHPLWWSRIESAKRRLVSSLIGLGLPVRPKTEDANNGMIFDLLRSEPGAPPVITGHDDGVITIDVEEADDAWREQRRAELAEPYRTLLGHLRHETGHYYWQRLVETGPLLEDFREQFGDEQEDYASALKRHYQQGARSDWSLSFVSAYASSHPWEDWAETWAHYLHLVDTLDTAGSFGLDGERVELTYERFDVSVLGTDDAQATEFMRLINSWMELTGVLNELSRSMGVPDFYPFVLSACAIRKLFVVHRVISAARP
jgi:hypothetical protein